MRHFIGFHNPTEMQGSLRARKKGYAVLTRKKGFTNEKCQGNCVWMFSRVNERAPNGKFKYHLHSWFLVDESVPLPRPTSGGSKSLLFDTVIEGDFGNSFVPPLYVTMKPWFDDLYVKTNNFSTGFTELRVEDIIQELLKLAETGETQHPENVIKSTAPKARGKK